MENSIIICLAGIIIWGTPLVFTNIFLKKGDETKETRQMNHQPAQLTDFTKPKTFLKDADSQNWKVIWVLLRSVSVAKY